MKIKLILLFFLFYLGSLLITLPAAQLLRFIPDRSGVQIAAVSGSLWDGHASQLTYKRKYRLQHLEWKIDWSALLTLHLKLDLKFNNGMDALSGNGAVLLGFSGIALENVKIDSSASELLAYARLPIPAKISGELSLVIKEAEQGVPYCQQLDGYLVWQNAKINSEMGNIDLDTAHIDLSCNKGQAVADLQQQSEQLSSTAHVLLKKDGVYQLQALLKAGDKLDPSIKDGLSWIGAKNKSGETVVNFNGKL